MSKKFFREILNLMENSVITEKLTPLRKMLGIESGPIYGYHGTVKANRGEVFFDKSRIHPKDQFLGEGFYFTLDPKIAEEYAHLRAIKLGEPLPKGHELNQGGISYFRLFNDDERIISTNSLMAGTDIEGKPIRNGQEMLTVDLSGLQNTKFIKSNADRLASKTAQNEGYDSLAFDGFTDRSKQIVVFPDFVDRVKILSRNDIE